MEISKSLKEALTKECENIKIYNLKENAKNISENYKKDNKQSITKKNDVLAYALSRMPATYGAVYSSVSQTLKNLTIMPKTLVDVGAGTGSATFATYELLDLENITCLEYQPEMLKLGEKLIKNNDQLNLITKWQSFDLLKNEELPSADLLICSYVLNELPESEQLKIVQKLWNATNNLLIIIEPGTPYNFKQMNKIRSFLLKEQANLIAPCAHSKPCPIKQNDWCHFTVRVERTKTHKTLKSGESPFEDEKFTYLAFSKLEKINSKSRVLRHPFYKPKVVSLEICNNNGEKLNLNVTKSNENYKLARKLKCGDEFL